MCMSHGVIVCMYECARECVCVRAHVRVYGRLYSVHCACVVSCVSACVLACINSYLSVLMCIQPVTVPNWYVNNVNHTKIEFLFESFLFGNWKKLPSLFWAKRCDFSVFPGKQSCHRVK